jgi:hypothetical protein
MVRVNYGDSKPMTPYENSRQTNRPYVSVNSSSEGTQLLFAPSKTAWAREFKPRLAWKSFRQWLEAMQLVVAA